VELIIVSGLVMVFALTGLRLDRFNITPPMVFLAAGALVFGLFEKLDVDSGVVHLLAELALVVVLFHDASTVQLRALRSDAGVPIRLLAIGFPLALVATLVVVVLMFPALGVAGALLLAASVTPTDAGLGAPTVLNPSVPVRVRRALNVESGLNDGLATPIVLFALALLAAEEGGGSHTILSLALIPAALALIVAVVVGAVAAWAIDLSDRSRASSATGRSVALLAVPFLSFGIATAIGANAFIAAFVAGLVFGAMSKANRAQPHTSQTLEIAADLLGYVVWFMAGGLLLLVLETQVKWQWVVAAVTILTVLRIVPVALSLSGVGFRPQTILFIGWFGPRGLATIVFALMAVEELGTSNPAIPDYLGVVTFTVLLSVFAHGVSAGPLSARYASWVAQAKPAAEAAASVAPRVRSGAGRHDDESDRARRVCPYDSGSPGNG
jgi:NhaP-type Na+/H+ or K+/H+ antiporter